MSADPRFVRIPHRLRRLLTVGEITTDHIALMFVLVDEAEWTTRRATFASVGALRMTLGWDRPGQTRSESYLRNCLKRLRDFREIEYDARQGQRRGLEIEIVAPDYFRGPTADEDDADFAPTSHREGVAGAKLTSHGRPDEGNATPLGQPDSDPPQLRTVEAADRPELELDADVEADADGARRSGTKDVPDRRGRTRPPEAGQAADPAASKAGGRAGSDGAALARCDDCGVEGLCQPYGKFTLCWPCAAKRQRAAGGSA